MKTYLMAWPDGTYAIALAKNEEHALDLSDEEGDPSICSVLEIKPTEYAEGPEAYMAIPQKTWRRKGTAGLTVTPGDFSFINLPYIQNTGELKPVRLVGDFAEHWAKREEEWKELECGDTST